MSMNISHLYELIRVAREKKCSDIHLTVGLPTMYRRNGSLEHCGFKLSDQDVTDLILSMLDEKQKKKIEEREDLDFAFNTSSGTRQRANVFYSMGRLCAVIRLLNDDVQTLEDLGLPSVLVSFAQEPRGLVLVTGPTGSGKSTTLASMISYINERKPVHILTIEDPVEYVYTPQAATIRQREVGKDVSDFHTALRSALREDPDVILVGEMRDYETISAAVTAAETGHLVLATLHTTSAAQTIDRIIDSCPPHSQNQIRSQLASVLRGVVTQTLVPLANGEGRIPAVEVLIGTDAVANLIRTNKCHQLETLMLSSTAIGMQTLNMSLAALYNMKKISRASALMYCSDRAEMKKLL
ncbi:MAG: type IV pilus twitching motility protein PilT [Oscillospiraceae bacterium]